MTKCRNFHSALLRDNVANLVPPFTSDGICHGMFTALEFAMQVLGARYIVVLDHACCGGIRAYADMARRCRPPTPSTNGCR